MTAFKCNTLTKTDVLYNYIYIQLYIHMYNDYL